MSDTSPRLELPYIQAAQAQKHVTHNEALRVLDVLVQLSVEAFDATTPPSLPQEGAVFALGAGASGAWTGHDGDLALSVDGYWDFYTPAQGWIATLAGSDTLRIWSGSAWEAPSIDTLDNLAKLGINTTADTTNRLAVSSPATLFSHAGDDHQMKINKASVGDTASLLFQSNWSGRAEMGLAGSDAFSIKVSADGSTWTEALTIDPATGRILSADAELGKVDLSAISDSIASTAVDVGVYDTSRDSDGGAWRDRCQHTSWYNEPLNTATRGARREFPAVAVIVAEANKVTIHDGDEPSLPIWKLWDFTGYTVSSVAALDGKIVVGLDRDGVVVIDLVSDEIDVTSRYDSTTTPALVSDSVNDVAMTVLPDAPASGSTGLKVPTIALATNSGVSVINNDGTVADLTAISGTATSVGFDENSTLTVTGGAAYTGRVDVYNDYASDRSSRDYGFNNNPGSFPNLLGNATSNAAFALSGGNTIFVRQSSVGGVSAIALSPTSPGESMVAYTTSSYTTGWMPGDIKGAWLAASNVSDLVVGTDADRSVNAMDLTVTGTITRTTVATGADLVAYSGFSSGVNELTLTDASIDDTLFGLCWVETSAGVWDLQHGVMSGAPVEGVSIEGTTLTIAGAKAKALLRLTATTPSADQLAKIEADERTLFQENAACTLYGASDAVTALAHDPVTDLLHVGTSAGRSDFQGLRRIANTTIAVTTAISAVDGLVSEQ